LTAVVGAIARDAIVFASDGFGLVQDGPGEPVLKDDLCSKLQITPDEKWMMGYSGSRDLALAVAPGTTLGSAGASDYASELSGLAGQLVEMKESHDRAAIVMLGYYVEAVPLLRLISADSGVGPSVPIVALGSGADLLYEYVEPRYSAEMGARSLAETLVEAVYRAACVPTVNSVPMIACLTASGGRDFSRLSIDGFVDFRKQLKDQISDEVGGWIREQLLRGD